jgi:Ca-activated chloride channel family protein
VNLILSVTNHRGGFVPNLTLSEMEILDNGKVPRKITRFEKQTNLPLHVVLLIDTSDSVTYCFKAEHKAAAVFLEHVLRSDSDLAAIIGFNQRNHLARSPTADIHLLLRAINGLLIGGKTAIYDAVAAGAQQLVEIKDVGPSRGAIILITDGDDNSSRLTLEQAVQLSQQDESIIYVLDTGEEYLEVKEAKNAMKKLSENTGGRFFRANDQKTMVRAFSKIEEELRSQYAIGYTPPNAVPDGVFHRISVITKKHLVVHHRQGYIAK